MANLAPVPLTIERGGDPKTTRNATRFNIFPIRKLFQSFSMAPETETPPNLSPSEPPPSYVKLAMRNMVRKGSKSLQHFTLTTIVLLGALVGLAYLTR